ncbi:MAG: hypothetical protein AAFQ67_00720 [Pseudomonadota bacterium]
MDFDHRLIKTEQQKRTGPSWTTYALTLCLIAGGAIGFYNIPTATEAQRIPAPSPRIALTDTEAEALFEERQAAWNTIINGQPKAAERIKLKMERDDGR